MFSLHIFRFFAHATRKTAPFVLAAGLICQSAMPLLAAVPVLGSKGDIASVKRQMSTGSANGADEKSTVAAKDNAAVTRTALSSAVPKALQNITAKSAIIIDDANGRVLFAKDPDRPRQPASTIKVLTGLIALHTLTGDEVVPISREAAARPSSKMYLDPKKTYRADELISGVLLGSANDASVALAELIAGSEHAFTRYMNQQASHFGATKTVCKTATGLTAKEQTSTARDLALIFQEAMRDKDFAARMKTRSMTTGEGKTVYNHNKALWRIKGAEGGKTGYTLAARQTYVGKFSDDGATFIVAIMGSETMWRDLKQMVNFAYSQYPLPQATEGRQVTTNLLARQVKAGSSRLPN
ncbi:MAG: D-alanyl-D-alanine carboxypeptidase family protein [Desulfopila sp.]